MHHHSCRLVDRDDVVVLVQHFERNSFRFGARRRPLSQLHLDRVAGPYLLRILRDLSVQPHQALLDQFLRARSGKLRTVCGHGTVQPLPRFFGGDGNLEVCRLLHAPEFSVNSSAASASAAETSLFYVRLPVAASCPYQWPESLMMRRWSRKST